MGINFGTAMLLAKTGIVKIQWTLQKMRHHDAWSSNDASY